MAEKARDMHFTTRQRVRRELFEYAFEQVSKEMPTLPRKQRRSLARAIAKAPF